MATANSSFKKRAKNHQIIYRPFILSLILIILGFLLMLAASVKSSWSFSFRQDLTLQAEEVAVTPVNIYVPKLDKFLDVSDGFVSNDRWTISEHGVSYLTTSALPGNRGNAVLYGHNRDEIFGKLWKVQDGDRVYVILSDGSVKIYEIFERKEIKPNQVEILDDVGDSRLTIYTCSGFLDSARFVVIGRLVTS